MIELSFTSNKKIAKYDIELALRFCRTYYSLKIPEGIEEISDDAFSIWEKHKYLQEIILPSTLKKIGNYAFCDCENLKNIEIPDSVTEIGQYAFLRCYNLENVTLPKNLKEISEGMFYKCKKIPEIKCPDSVIKIGCNAFSYCDSLKKVSFGENVKTFGNQVFKKCNLLDSIEISDKNEYFKVDSNEKVFYVSSTKKLIRAFTGENEKFIVPNFIQSISRSSLSEKLKTLEINFPLQNIDSECADENKFLEKEITKFVQLTNAKKNKISEITDSSAVGLLRAFFIEDFPYTTNFNFETQKPSLEIEWKYGIKFSLKRVNQKKIATARKRLSQFSEFLKTKIVFDVLFFDEIIKEYEKCKTLFDINLENVKLDEKYLSKDIEKEISKFSNNFSISKFKNAIRLDFSLFDKFLISEIFMTESYFKDFVIKSELENRFKTIFDSINENSTFEEIQNLFISVKSFATVYKID